MSRKDPVTKDALFAAADELAAAGDTPNLQKLRAKVGGSFTTIGPWFTEWKAQQSQQTTAVLEMPDSMLAAIKTAGAEMWKAATAVAGERVHQVEQDAAGRVSTAEQLAREYADEIQRLEAELEQSERNAQDARKDAEAATSKVTTLKTENARLETSVTEKYAELQKADDRYNHLQKRHDHLQAQLIEATSKASAAEQVGQGRGEEIQRLKLALEQSEKSAQDARRDAQTATGSITDLKADNSRLETAMAEKTAELEKEKHRHDQLQQRYDQLQAQMVELAKVGQTKKPRSN